MLNLNYEPEVIVETSGLTKEEWLNYRRQGIGGSDVAAIMGQSPFCTARDLFYDKIGKKPVVEEEDNWIAKEVGNLLENLVAKIFSKQMGLEVFPIRKMFRHPIYPFMAADVDFFIQFPDGKKGILECKTTNYNCRNKWDNDSVPINYEFQCRHYLSVLNLDVAYIACLFGNNENEFVIRRIDRDLDFESDLIENEAFFWKEYVQMNIKPPYTEKSDLVLASLRRHYGTPYGDDEKLILEAEYEQNIKDYLELKKQKSLVDAESKKLAEQMKQKSIPLIERLGPNNSALLTTGSNHYDVTNKTEFRTGINKDGLARLKLLQPKIYHEYVTTTEIQKFMCKWKEIK